MSLSEAWMSSWLQAHDHAAHRVVDGRPTLSRSLECAECVRQYEAEWVDAAKSKWSDENRAFAALFHRRNKMKLTHLRADRVGTRCGAVTLSTMTTVDLSLVTCRRCRALWAKAKRLGDCECDSCNTCQAKMRCPVCNRCARCSNHVEGCAGCPGDNRGRRA